MSSVHRSALVPRPASLVFDIVNEFEAYPKRFAWCTAATIVGREPDAVLARLTLRFAGLQTTFVTRNRAAPHTRIELTLVDGPFAKLEGAWRFRALGADGCKVSLDLDFEFAGKLVGSALALGFQGFADHMVDEFVGAALAA
jgi:ribosome-associated toxin RatA of RatAB toxin-antitoxin module